MRLQESAMELPTFNREVPSLNDEAKRVSDEAPSLSVECLSLTREAPSVSVDSPRVSVEAKRVTDEVKRVIVDSQRLNCQPRNINFYSQLDIKRLFLTTARPASPSWTTATACSGWMRRGEDRENYFLGRCPSVAAGASTLGWMMESR